MPKLKKGFMMLSLLLVFALILTGCGPKRDTADQASAGDSGSKKEQKVPDKPDSLKMWVNAEDAQVKALRKIADKYEEKTGIKVKFEEVSALKQTDKLAVAGPQGNGPDLFFQPHDRLGDVVVQGLAAPIDQYLTEDEKSEYSKAAINAVTVNYKEQGDSEAKAHLYAFPAVIETYALYYNKDLVKNPPKTFDELKSMAKDLTDAKQKKYGFVFEGNNFYYTYPFLKNFGGYIFGGGPGHYDTSDIGVATDGAVEGMSYLKSFFTDGLIPQSVNGDVVNGLFTSGKAAMVINGPWMIPDYKKALGDKLGTAPLPNLNGKPATSFSGVKGWLVSYYSKNKYWAADLGKFLTNDESAKTYFEIAGEIPPRPGFLENLDEPVYKGFTEQIKASEPMPNIPEMSAVWDPMNNASKLFIKGKDVEKVLNDAKKQIEEGIQSMKQ